MTEQQVQLDGSTFGRVLSELMAARGIQPTASAVAELAEACGIDPVSLLACTRREHQHVVPLSSIADLPEALGLTEAEQDRLERALHYEREY